MTVGGSLKKCMMLRGRGKKSTIKYAALQQCFSHSRLVIYFLPTSLIKLKLAGRLVIATLLDQSTVWIANGKQAC
jgi:hypothetical protein